MNENETYLAWVQLNDKGRKILGETFPSLVVTVKSHKPSKGIFLADYNLPTITAEFFEVPLEGWTDDELYRLAPVIRKATGINAHTATIMKDLKEGLLLFLSTKWVQASGDGVTMGPPQKPSRLYMGV